MDTIEYRWEGEYIVVYLNGEKVPRDKIPEFVDKYLKPGDIDNYPPEVWEFVRLRDILKFTLPAKLRIPLLYLLPYDEEEEGE